MAILAIFRPRRIAVLVTAHGHLRRFDQQETQQRVPLFRDVSQAPSLSARILQRHQSQIARDLLTTLKPIGSADDQHERQCRERTDSGMRLQALRRGTLLHFLLDGRGQLGNRRRQPIQQLQQITPSPARPRSDLPPIFSPRIMRLSPGLGSLTQPS